ncbi:MAG TPA: DNA integrity scanning diadenylate cyclase DisA [Candidatus Bipolaricaulota bacterium]
MSHKQRFTALLAQVAPGTPLREALESITRLGKGALILIADREQAAPVIHGGFELDTQFTPQKLTELSKMDRAIVVDENLRKILYANVMLVADQEIHSEETGTRHLAAEKVSKQLGVPTIAVSSSKGRVTLYCGDISYILPDFSTLTVRVNQALHILEQYRSTLDNLLWELTSLEFEDRVLSDDVASVIQLTVQMLQVEEDTLRWFIELGTEKALHEQLLEWLMKDVKNQLRLLLRDYQRNEQTVDALATRIRALPHDKLFSTDVIMEILGYDRVDEEAEITLSPRGFRVLHELHRLPASIAERVVDAFGKLSRICESTEEDLTQIKGIGMVRARTIRTGITHMKTMYNSFPQELRHGRKRIYRSLA